MIIKVFYVSVYHSMHAHHSIIYKNGKFEYRTEPKYREEVHEFSVNATQEEIEHNEVLSGLDSFSADLSLKNKRLIRFYNYITKNCTCWKSQYPSLDLDGTSWECNIWIDDFKLKSEGHNRFPKKFDEFLHKLSILTEGKVF